MHENPNERQNPTDQNPNDENRASEEPTQQWDPRPAHAAGDPYRSNPAYVAAPTYGGFPTYGAPQTTPGATAPFGTPPSSPGPTPGTSTHRQRSGTPILVAVLAAGLIGGGLGAGGVALLDHRDSAPAALTSAPSSPGTVNATPGSVTYAAKVASKSTADIAVSGAQGTAVGSGIILTADGYTLTNNHVVSGVGDGGRIQVTLPDGTTHAATVTGVAPSYDLAVIKVSGVSGLTPATLGQSNGLQVGQQVVAVGSPENLSNTVTSGIISALSRTVTAGDESGSQVAVYNGLQTDTPINPGNSGGPLVNLQGQVVGVNSAVDTGQAAGGGVQAFGLGFSIPVDTAKRVAEQLMQNGTATKPVLGVSGSLSETTNASQTSVNGARVGSVSADGAAARAGLRAGDVITAIDGSPISNYADLMAQVLRHQPGQQIPITVTDTGGKSEKLTVTLGSAKDDATTTVSTQSAPSQQGSPDQGSPDQNSPDQGSPFDGLDPFGQ
ncbi:S1C family serine protease [Williamsia sp. MIQD14]|uniref:S1C family serine protease n=1 Tax=Williamsia sp. MIQD14 TaxID=3425703 RepID=UPI003DA06DEC